MRAEARGRGDSVVGAIWCSSATTPRSARRFARANDQPATRVSQLARNVAAAGVKRVEGRILADDSIFDRERRAGPDLSPLSGLSFNNGYDGGDYARSPELVAAKGLKSALRKRGVRVDGQVGRANLPAATLESEPLAAVASPTVAKLIEETNVPSNNFFAEMLLKWLAATSGRKGTRQRQRQGRDVAASVGTAVESVDGLGPLAQEPCLARARRQLLVAMAKDEQNAAAFRDSLPVAGREGTVADRMRGTAAEGNCATKTGTLSDVSALSGYRDGRHGRLLHADERRQRRRRPPSPGPDRCGGRPLSAVAPAREARADHGRRGVHRARAGGTDARRRVRGRRRRPRGRPGAGIVAGDVAEPGPWQEAARGCEVVVHTAALVGTPTDVSRFWHVNVRGTRLALEAARDAGARRFVHLSSVVTFGLHFPDGVDETHPVRPTGVAYTDTKIAAEQVVLMAHAGAELEVVVVRPGDVYGPASRPGR